MRSGQSGNNATPSPGGALLLAFWAIAFYFMAPPAAFAGMTPMGEVLCMVIDFIINGNLGRGLASLAIISVGIAALLGKASWGMALTVGVGIGVIFGAFGLASLLLGINTCALCPGVCP